MGKYVIELSNEEKCILLESLMTRKLYLSDYLVKDTYPEVLKIYAKAVINVEAMITKVMDLETGF